MNARTAVKEAVYGLAHAAGLPAWGRLKRRNSLTILTYHSFGPAAEHPYLHRLPVARFAEQVRHIMRHFDVVGLENGLARLGTPEADTPMLSITIDDGYADNFTHMLPILKEANLPATVFVATGYIDSGLLPWPTRLSAMLHHATRSEVRRPLAITLSTPAGRLSAGRTLRQHLSRLDHEAREAAIAELKRELVPRTFEALPPLTWDQIRTMRQAGVSIGSHTHFHGWLDCLSPGDVDTELTLSRRRIEEETDAPCNILAYPNGNWNPSVTAAAERAGYRWALTQDNGVNRSEGLRPLALHRTEVPYDERIGSFACRVGGIAL